MSGRLRGRGVRRRGTGRISAIAGTKPRKFFFKVFMQNNIEPVIEVRGLSKRVKHATGELTILDQIDLSIARGSSVAIVGASGSGKSTLLGLLAELDSASEGSVRLLGKELSTS